MECCCCLTTKPAARFPSRNPTTACDHPIRTCKVCLSHWIYHSLKSRYQPYLGCPECNEQMIPDADLQNRTWARARYQQVYSRIVKGMLPGWRWCLEGECRDGGVCREEGGVEEEEDTVRERRVRFSVDEDDDDEEDLEPRVHRKSRKTKEEPEIWGCGDKDCAGMACVLCDRPWHEGMTCEEYAWRNMKHLVEDWLSRKAIEGLRAQGRIRDCPQCQCAIEKDGLGGDVHCTRCLYSFRWDDV